MKTKVAFTIIRRGREQTSFIQNLSFVPRKGEMVIDVDRTHYVVFDVWHTLNHSEHNVRVWLRTAEETAQR